ncbi:hypothetical protein AB5J49_46965 [Streptomyces sp. R28]|uniref:Uncharacterized protein n=1 Tax=Streptomyces sp. R28 TaxID=3238628 RepID=A0AB39QCA1_9ACTN
MTALNESLAKPKASRGEGPAEIHDLPKKKTTAKSTAPKRPTKKAAVAKKTGKKSSGRRPRSA